MKWLCRASVCKTCKVLFEPATGYEAKWGDLCPAHRRPVIEEFERVEAIVSWAKANTKAVGQLMDKEIEERERKHQEMMQHLYSAQHGRP